jgi:hypothetical protein
MMNAKKRKGDSGIVEYRYIKKRVYNIDNPSHILAKGRMPGITDGLSVKRNEMGAYEIDASKSDLQQIEKELALAPGTLNTNNRFNKYFEDINIVMGVDTLRYNLSDPYERLLDKVLRAYDNVIAPDLKSVRNKPTYRYVRVVEGEEDAMASAEYNTLKELYKELGKLEENRIKMLMYLSVIGTRINPSIKDSTLINLVNKEASKSVEVFLQIIRSDDFIYKGSVMLGAQLKVISIKASMYFYKDEKLADGNNVATIDEAINFLKSGSNSDIWVSIQKDIKNAIDGTK